MKRWLPIAITTVILAVSVWVLTDQSGHEPSEVRDEPVVAAGAAPAAGVGVAQSPLTRVTSPPVQEPRAVAALRLRVLDGEGRPAVGARVATLDFSAAAPCLHGVYETDDRGEVDLGPWSPALGAERPFVIAHAHHAPVFLHASQAAGTEEVRLAQDLALAGIVRVDGAAPHEQIPVQVRGFRDPAAFLPPIAREVLAQWGLGGGVTTCWIGTDGRFTLRGLPPGEMLELIFPEGFVLLGDLDARHPAQLTVSTPNLDLQVDLRRLPAIRGRLMRFIESQEITIGADGFPEFRAFPSLMMNLEWTCEVNGQRHEGSSPVSSGSDFSIPLPWPRVDHAELRVRDVDSTLLGARVLPGPIEGGCDIGAWTVPDAERVMQLRVIGESGAPVAGAISVAHGAVQGRTDADGRLRLALRAAPGTLTVGAFGHRIRREPIPDPPPAELTIRLEAASRLRMEVVQPDGAPARQVVAVISFGGSFPQDAPEAVPGFEEVHGPPPSGAIWSEGWREHHYALADGIGEWSDLPLDVEFTLQVRDLYDNLLYEESLRLAPVEERTVRVVVPRAGRVIGGRVMTPDGAPIAGASIGMGGMFQEVRSDAAGRFALDFFYGAAPELWIAADGRVTVWIRAPDFVPDADWVLEPARSVWIVAQDAGGVRVPAGLGPLLEVDGGWKGSGQERGPGLYEVTGVPLRPGVITVPGTASEPVRIGPDQTDVLISVRP